MNQIKAQLKEIKILRKRYKKLLKAGNATVSRLEDAASKISELLWDATEPPGLSDSDYISDEMEKIISLHKELFSLHERQIEEQDEFNSKISYELEALAEKKSYLKEELECD